MCQELREAARILSSLQFRSLGARKVTLWLLVLKDVLLHQVNVISITREHIYVFLLELAAALVWNRTSLIILLPSSFLLVYPPGLSHTKVKHHLLCAHNVHPLPTKLIYPKKTLHHRIQRAQNKMAKQQRLLREVNVPSGQFNMTHQELHDVVTVFDCGCHNNPPIRPPDRVHWRCIPVSQLHREDESNPSVGLTFPRINNALPFILVPRRMSLDIIGQSGPG